MNSAFKWMTTACMAGVMGLSITGCKMGDASTDKSDANGMKDSMMEKKDIIDTATGPGMTEVTTLVTAVKAAGLVDTLKGPGPFTVFAPTNAAFAKLPAGTVDDLLKPENKEKLKSILLYHVTSVTNGQDRGSAVNIKVDGDTVMVNNAKVIKANIVCSNGIIHWSTP